MSDVIKINPIDPKVIASGISEMFEPEEATMRFITPHKTLLELSNDGFRFGDELITDAGEAHRAFLEVMRLMKKELDPTKEKGDE